MSDLISRRAVEDLIAERVAVVTDPWWCEGMTRAIFEGIKHLPTIDAVPVVRCKDCKWWDKSDDSPFGYCMAMKHGYMSKNWEIGIYRRYKGDFYCADAERSEDGGE